DSDSLRMILRLRMVGTAHPTGLRNSTALERTRTLKVIGVFRQLVLLAKLPEMFFGGNAAFSVVEICQCGLHGSNALGEFLVRSQFGDLPETDQVIERQRGVASFKLLSGNLVKPTE